jgi:hypothetical protein
MKEGHGRGGGILQTKKVVRKCSQIIGHQHYREGVPKHYQG